MLLLSGEPEGFFTAAVGRATRILYYCCRDNQQDCLPLLSGQPAGFFTTAVGRTSRETTGDHGRPPGDHGAAPLDHRTCSTLERRQHLAAHSLNWFCGSTLERRQHLPAHSLNWFCGSTLERRQHAAAHSLNWFWPHRSTAEPVLRLSGGSTSPLTR